jgi:hypothetical protein
MEILFLNHSKIACGVYQYGVRLYNILKKDTYINYIYKEIESQEEHSNILQSYNKVQIIMYNYHVYTMPWLFNTDKSKLNIGITHEVEGSGPEYAYANNLFNIVIDIDPSSGSKYSIPRPIYEDVEYIQPQISNDTIKNFIDYNEENVPIFGSFGFSFTSKGFQKIIKYVNEQYDKAIIKFVIPLPYFDPNKEINHLLTKKMCYEVNRKEGIKLLLCHEFFSNEEMLLFLKSNTANIFLYDYMKGRGNSSTLDYALSVKRPLIISDSYMFRHIYSDDICIYKNDIETCMKNSLKYCDKFVKEYSHENMINKFRNIIQNLSNSQAGQDIFVINCLNKKMNGIYIEIGSHCPNSFSNNTFVLDKVYNWKGLLVDYDSSHEESYKKSRPNSQYIINDARKINYREFLDSNNYPLNIDYLQIDLEANNKSTLDVLNIFDSSVFTKYKFATVTFEHDIYTGDWFDTRNISREIFKKNGYILVFPDVKVYYDNSYCPFEDWYIHPGLVDMDFINKIKTEESLFHEDIQKIIFKNV